MPLEIDGHNPWREAKWHSSRNFDFAKMSVKANKQVFLSILIDITQRMSLESEKATQTELHRAIVDNAVFAIITTSPNGTITSFNPATERLLGHTFAKTDLTINHVGSEIQPRAS